MSLRLRLLLALALAPPVAWGLYEAITQWPLPQALVWLAWGSAPEPRTALAITGALMLLLAAWAARALLGPLERTAHALHSAVLSYRDGDYSFGLARDGAPRELAELLRLHGELGDALRAQRQQLAQRELLLDTLVQHTPVAMLLLDAQGHIAYANLAARNLLADGRALGTRPLAELLTSLPAAMAEALQQSGDQLFAVPADAQHAGQADERYHLIQRGLALQGLPHRLLLLRRMTRELSRQEVAAWKRAIRVISHELNNSLAPISSMAHSGAELARRGDVARAEEVFGRIGERARHLHGFLEGYACFAKLPSPRPEAVAWAPFVQALASQWPVHITQPLPEEAACFDPGQMTQALLNLLKNAHEAGGPPDAVSLSVTLEAEQWCLCVQDRGPGMSEAVLAQALLPFYSTKRSGTGLGLALAREIAEAHGGRIGLANRSEGGLSVSVWLPR